MDRTLKWLSWIPALYAAYIMLWYEQYKLTADEGSVALFTTLTDWLFLSGHEQAMRLGVASMEIVASVLLINWPSRLYGAIFAMGIMSGAIFFHVVSPLGIDPYGDGGMLFKEACATWLASAVVIAIYHRELRDLLGEIGILPMRSAY